MSLTFKVTIPQGGLLEKELKDKKGRERTIHLYILAEIGARALRNLTGGGAGDLRVNDCEVKKTEPSEAMSGGVDQRSDEDIGEVDVNNIGGFVTFDKSDLLAM